MAVGILDKAKENKADIPKAENVTLISEQVYRAVADRKTKIVTAAYLDKNAVLYDKLCLMIWQAKAIP